MRNPERIDRILELVRAIWKKYPDLRLCQLMSNAGFAVCKNNDIFNVEDDKLEAELRRQLEG